MPLWRSVLGTLFAAVVGGGCHTFAPTDDAGLIAGRDIRVTVSDAEALRLSHQTGRLERSYDGRLLRMSDDSLYMVIASYRAALGVQGARLMRQEVAVSRAESERLANRELSMWRSGVLATLAAGGVYLLINQLSGSGSLRDAGNGEPLGTLVPIARISN